MKLKATGLLLALSVFLGVMALPAAAAVSVGAKAGVFTGVAIVGKTGTCAQDGSHTISGGGIGLVPETTDVKNAWYGIDSPDGVLDATGGAGSLKLCGRLTAPLQDTPVPCNPPDPEDPTCTEPLDVKALGIGASCAATKGWGGQGKASLAGTAAKDPQEIWISNLGWKVTLGGTFIVTGDVGGLKGKKQDLLIAQVQALSEGAVNGCLAKTQGRDKITRQPFDVVAAYQIIPYLGCDRTYCDKKPPKKTP